MDKIYKCLTLFPCQLVIFFVSNFMVLDDIKCLTTYGLFIFTRGAINQNLDTRPI